MCKNQWCLRSSCLYICDCRRTQTLTQTRMQTPCLGSHSLRIKLLATHTLIHAGFMHIPDLMRIISSYKSSARKDQSYSQLLKKNKKDFCFGARSNQPFADFAHNQVILDIGHIKACLPDQSIYLPFTLFYVNKTSESVY